MKEVILLKDMIEPLRECEYKDVAIPIGKDEEGILYMKITQKWGTFLLVVQQVVVSLFL